MHAAIREPDAIGAHHVAGVRQELGDELVVAVVEHEQDRQVLLDQQVAQGILGGLADLGDVVGEQLADVLDRLPSAVLVFRDGRHPGVGAITLDDVHGGELATKHLLASGHRNIGLISGPVISLSTTGRLQGYQNALEEANLSVNENWIRNCPPVVGSGYEHGKELLQEHPEITALFCHNDLIAVGVLQACSELGRRVPEDVAVIGYDDIRLAALVTPSLTTLKIPREMIGTRVMQMLLGQISSDNGSAESLHLKPELIVRQSAP